VTHVRDGQGQSGDDGNGGRQVVPQQQRTGGRTEQNQDDGTGPAPPVLVAGRTGESRVGGQAGST
jgi:hypothetical protein